MTDEEINARLQKINKPFVKSIQSPDGDIIDCVLFQHQPAFDLPGLSGHTILIPPELPKGLDDDEEDETDIKQLWNSKGESCPNGTIPIKRATANDLIKKTMPTFMLGRNDSLPMDAAKHEYAVAYTKEGEYYGAKAILNVWEPYVAGNDFSLSQVWIVTHHSPHPINTIEVGWQVFPHKYNDNRPRLFTYWTADGYRTGCYNLACSGFVQTDYNYVLGGALHPISTYNGKQYIIRVTIWKQPSDGHWWLKVGKHIVGYRPSLLFPDLQYYATEVHYGGEVAQGNPNSGRHTSTQMGSGHFPDEGFGKAAYVRNLDVIDPNSYIQPASDLALRARNPNCYGIKKGYSKAWANYFYFGGPGYGPYCQW